MQKILIYQVLPRIFGNKNNNKKTRGSISENGCGKFNDFSEKALKSIKKLGTTHIWYTGVIEHATQTDYSAFGIKGSTASVVKGIAGSPYAIRDYYDVDPDLATNVESRMQEFESLIGRTHNVGLKAIIDFVPNHVAREYFSDAKPSTATDFGENDNKDWHFSAQNNFYYFPNNEFNPQFDKKAYEESPAKATGNDCFSPSPSINDWYETVKLNYGVDYCGGGQKHFDPIPDTWLKMRDILLFWAKKGVDGFRCDMAEMVPVEFWHWAIEEVKRSYPEIIFIAEVYNPQLYREYIHFGGFDFLYDKVGMYDTLRNIIGGYQPATSITNAWQCTNDIQGNMLHFLENHDEQRIASSFFASDAQKAFPAAMVSSLLTQAPFMIYSGQEFGEQGMDSEGFSGEDGRSTIFDYWSLDCINRWRNEEKFNSKELLPNEKMCLEFYSKLGKIAQEKVIAQGTMYDLMWLNLENPDFDTTKQFAWIRKFGKETLLLVANFSSKEEKIKLRISDEALNFLNIKEEAKNATDLLSNKKMIFNLSANAPLSIKLKPNYGIVWKWEE